MDIIIKLFRRSYWIDDFK